MRNLPSFAATLVLVVSLNSVLAPAAEPQHPDQPKDYAAIVGPKLPPGWRCTHDFSTLIIAHDEPVTLLNRLGLPGHLKGEALFKEFGIQSSFLFVMKFVPRLSHEEQKALFDARKKATHDSVIASGGGKNTGGHAYRKWFVPAYYNHRFSINLDTTDSWPLELVSPADVVQERKAILDLLESLMEKYPKSP